MNAHRLARPHRWLSLLLSATVAFAGAAHAQCQLQWQGGPPIPGTDGPVNAVVEWDPDGAGPRTPVVVLGGRFAVAGNVAAARVATYDPADGTWTALDNPAEFVTALAVLGNGDLVAATQRYTPFLTAVERWNGTSWVSLGAFTGFVNELVVLANGELIAAGNFTHAGGTPANCVASWNGTAWAPLGSGVGAEVLALVAHPNGDLVAGGWFGQLGSGATVNFVARWDGAAWSALGSGVGFGVAGLAVTPAGDVIASGSFLTAGSLPARRVARWNGSSWSAMGNGVPDGGAVVALANGEVLVGGPEVHRWDGVGWSQLGDFAGGAYGFLPLANGDVFVTGDFTRVDRVAATHVAVWRGAAWSQVGPPSVPTSPASLTIDANGDPILGAGVPATNASGVRVARWSGTSWVPLGPPFVGGGIDALLTTASGDLVAGGEFGWVGGVPMSRIARWNGSAWTPMGSGLSGASATVHALAELPGGDIVAAGSFTQAGGVAALRIARWNGSAWSPIGTGLGNSVRSLTIAANGDLVVGGSSVLIGTARVARWNGSTWVGLGTMNSVVSALATLPNGDLVAGGGFTSTGTSAASCIARWDGSAWHALGSGMTLTGDTPIVTGLGVLPDGDVVASGRFDTAGGTPAASIARWNGTTWTALATTQTVLPGAVLRDVTVTASGSVFVAGSTSLDGVVSAGFARLATSCPASATPSAPGCTGSGGANVLAATSLPWTGSTYRGRATGLPTNGLALGLLGWSTVALPLSTLLPQGGAGCTLHVAPDVVATLLPTAGAASTQLAIPNSSALAGLVIHEQVLALDLAGASLVAFTATNRLTLTIGAL